MDAISLGFDIATSISIIGAAISFFISQKKARKQSQMQYAVSNLKDFLSFVSDSGRKFDQIGNMLRLEPNQENLDKNILHVIFLLEDIKRELKSQNEIYYPIFTASSQPPKSLIDCAVKLDELIEKAKRGRGVFMEVLENVEPFLGELERSVANEFRDMLSGS